MHGSRSGRPQSTHDEFTGTSNWAQVNPEGLGWTATVGDGEVCVHLDPRDWGHNARAASNDYIAVELAQPTVNDDITDGQVSAFVWWWMNEVEPVWPGIPRNFPSHAELEVRGETAFHDGKTDVFPNGDPRMDELRARIMALLG